MLRKSENKYFPLLLRSKLEIQNDEYTMRYLIFADIKCADKIWILDAKIKLLGLDLEDPLPSEGLQELQQLARAGS